MRTLVETLTTGMRARRIALGAVAAAVILAFGVTMAHAQGVPGISPNKCLSGKAKCVNEKVAGLLKCRWKCQKSPTSCGTAQTACENKVMAKFNGDGIDPATSCFGKLEAKDDGVTPEKICTTTGDLAAMEAKADAMVAGIVATLESGRFVDNGHGTVTDNWTGLQWEKKTTAAGSGQNFADPHDVNNRYSWSSGGSDPDGTVFTDFLGELNNGCESADGITVTGGFAEHCDWRLPTIAELQTILLAPYPCGTSPCIDTTVFGPTVASGYWSSTIFVSNPSYAWGVCFGSGYVFDDGGKSSTDYIRAVRGGS